MLVVIMQTMREMDQSSEKNRFCSVSRLVTSFLKCGMYVNYFSIKPGKNTGLLAILSARGWRFAFDSNPRAIQHQKFYFYKEICKKKKSTETLIEVSLTTENLSNIYLFS